MASGNGAGGGSSGISQPVPGFGGAGNGTGDCTESLEFVAEFGAGIVSPGGTTSGGDVGRSMGCSSPGMKRGSNPLGENTGRVGTG